jgi:hypothetical protein
VKFLGEKVGSPPRRYIMNLRNVLNIHFHLELRLTIHNGDFLNGEIFQRSCPVSIKMGIFCDNLKYLCFVYILNIVVWF